MEASLVSAVCTNPGGWGVMSSWKVDVRINNRPVTTSYQMGWGLRTWKILAKGYQGFWSKHHKPGERVQMCDLPTLSRVPDTLVEEFDELTEPVAPTLGAVLVSLLLDSQCVDGQTFEEFCGSFGYDTDSRKAEGIYKACQTIHYQTLQCVTMADLETCIVELFPDCL